jgi:hypothetical protein
MRTSAGESLRFTLSLLAALFVLLVFIFSLH